MNTPSHYILNLAVLGKTIAPDANVAITLGAILPDIPIFIFYLIAKYIYKLPEKKIWTETYYEPFWQNIIAVFHSFPLAIIGFIICNLLGNDAGMIAFMSMILHYLCDFPLHHDDAHRHFYPFSNYRFISPVSYWDTKHYGQIAASVELSLVLAAIPLVFPLLNSVIAKAIIIIIGGFYLVGYFRLYRVVN